MTSETITKPQANLKPTTPVVEDNTPITPPTRPLGDSEGMFLYGTRNRLTVDAIRREHERFHRFHEHAKTFIRQHHCELDYDRDPHTGDLTCLGVRLSNPGELPGRWTTPDWDGWVRPWGTNLNGLRLMEELSFKASMLPGLPSCSIRVKHGKPRLYPTRTWVEADTAYALVGNGVPYQGDICVSLEIWKRLRKGAR